MGVCGWQDGNSPVAVGQKQEGIPRKEEGRVGCKERGVVMARWIDGVIIHWGSHVAGYGPLFMDKSGLGRWNLLRWITCGTKDQTA